MRALIVEDEVALREQVAARLKDVGYVVDEAGDGEEGLYFAMEYPLDVAVVDVGLPGMTGIEMVRQLRASGRGFPVLILTARARWQDKVDGLEAGADDYVVKPFHMEELLARLRALVRRAGGWSQDILKCEGVELDVRSQAVTVKGAGVDLTAYEYKVIEYLMLNAGEVISKTVLGEHVYGEDLDPDSNVLEVLVGRVRRKLDPTRALAPIETLRGRGYRFRLKRDGA
ncbi:MAG: response regulator transcription factor [Chromatiales bacterium]|jgi:two-component system, OmpR family, response regulator PhoP|nr:response regulator transcription factor [Chromatiales bacterium]